MNLTVFLALRRTSWEHIGWTNKLIIDVSYLYSFQPCRAMQKLKIICIIIGYSGWYFEINILVARSDCFAEGLHIVHAHLNSSFVERCRMTAAVRRVATVRTLDLTFDNNAYILVRKINLSLDKKKYTIMETNLNDYYFNLKYIYIL